jgi:hypothetical protein
MRIQAQNTACLVKNCISESVSIVVVGTIGIGIAIAAPDAYACQNREISDDFLDRACAENLRLTEKDAYP